MVNEYHYPPFLFDEFYQKRVPDCVREYIDIILEHIGGVDKLKDIDFIILTGEYHLFNQSNVIELNPANHEVI